MVSASWALQKSVYQALANSSELSSLLGGPRIYDDAPQAAGYPFVTLGQSLVRDWSTGTEDGGEHVLTLHVWSRSGGKKQTHASSRRSSRRCMIRSCRCRVTISSICATNLLRQGSTRTATPFTASCATAR